VPMCSESVRVKCWDNGRYALASENYDATNPFEISDTPTLVSTDNIERAITKEMLDPDVAASPSAITHKIYCFASSTWDKLRVPVSVGVGGAYEFCQDNAAFEGYELFLKAGFSF